MDIADQPSEQPVAEAEEPTPTKKKKSASLETVNSILAGIFQLTQDEAKLPDYMAEEELLRYLQEEPVELTAVPMLWWKENCSRYKHLAQLARKYLCLPATSVPSERLFSTAGNIVSAKRSCLDADNVR